MCHNLYRRETSVTSNTTISTATTLPGAPPPSAGKRYGSGFGGLGFWVEDLGAFNLNPRLKAPGVQS